MVSREGSSIQSLSGVQTALNCKQPSFTRPPPSVWPRALGEDTRADCRKKESGLQSQNLRRANRDEYGRISCGRPQPLPPATPLKKLHGCSTLCSWFLVTTKCNIAPQMGKSTRLVGQQTFSFTIPHKTTLCYCFSSCTSAYSNTTETRLERNIPSFHFCLKMYIITYKVLSLHFPHSLALFDHNSPR